MTTQKPKSRVACPHNMTNVEAALYWCTESLVIPGDVPGLTGLPEEECSRITSQIKRVRKLYAESFEPVFKSYNGLLRPLSRELEWVNRYVPEGGDEAYETFVTWAKSAKVGDKRRVVIWLGDKPESETIFVCERVQ